MAILMRGGGQKRNDHWPFWTVKVGMDIIPERQCLNKSNFLFHRTEGSNYGMLEITWQVSTSKAVCTERKESLSVPLNYTVLNK